MIFWRAKTGHHRLKNKLKRLVSEKCLEKIIFVALRTMLDPFWAIGAPLGDLVWSSAHHLGF